MMNRETHIGGIVLAAGSSRRYGEDKRLSKLASGRTMLEESIHQAASVLDRLVVILRFGDVQLAEALDNKLSSAYAGKQIHCYCAPDSARGMAHSLANAIHLVGEWEAAAIFLGDMPYLQIETIQKLVDSCHNNMAKEPIVVPVKSGRQGHPVIFHHHYFNEIEALEGDQGAKPVIDAHRQAVIEVSLDDEGIFMDIDRPQEAVCS